MEIKNKLTVTKEEGKGDIRGSRGRGKSKNMYRGPMGMDKCMGVDCGEWTGQGKAIWTNVRQP